MKETGIKDKFIKLKEAFLKVEVENWVLPRRLVFGITIFWIYSTVIESIAVLDTLSFFFF